MEHPIFRDEDIRDVPNETLPRLMEVGRLLVSELDFDTVLHRVLETARELTGARYAAIGVLNDRRDALSRFLTLGIGEPERRAIGPPPTGRGVLGALIEHPVPLRLADVGRDPRSFGFPDGHPSMGSFLGVPISIRGEAWGNIYLTEKRGGEFTPADQGALVILADWAAIAIDNARHFQESERRRLESERMARHLRVTRDVAVAIGRETDLGRVLELVVKRARALVAARSAVVWLLEGNELVLRAATAGVEAPLGLRVPAAGSQSSEAMRSRRPQRLAVANTGTHAEHTGRLGGAQGEPVLIVPMLTHGVASGVLVALRSGEHGPFSDEHEALLETFAAGAAAAVGLAQTVEHDRLRAALESAEAERGRWARELHDETLQGLAGLRVLLGGALRQDDHRQTRQGVGLACESLEDMIENLRSIVTELRPPTLDELGLCAALETLLERQSAKQGYRLASEVAVRSRAQRGGRLDPGLENAAYRLVQEALTNVNKHADADNVRVAVVESDTEIAIEIGDDGVGFDPTQMRTGFGLAGMRERVALTGGTIDVKSAGAGTVVRISLPLCASADALSPRGQPISA